jgi:hypothetical protein
MKIQANYWYRIIDHYHNILNEKFINQLYTPATQHYMRQLFDQEVKKARLRETHPAWHIPLELRFEPLQHRFIIEAASQHQPELI